MNRKRIVSSQKFKAGDIVKAEIPNTKGKHICIILENENSNGHQNCIHVCNFTGSPVIESKQYVIDISKHDLPKEWFENKKPTSWIRCNERDCIYAYNFENEVILGNIQTDYPDLWSEVCREMVKCPISDRLKIVCNCEEEKINNQNTEVSSDENNRCSCETS